MSNKLSLDSWEFMIFCTLLCEQLGSLVGITFRMLTTDINSCNLFALFSIFSMALPTIASQQQYLVLFFNLKANKHLLLSLLREIERLLEEQKL